MRLVQFPGQMRGAQIELHMKEVTNPLLSRVTQQSLDNLANYQPATTRSISNYYIKDTTIKSESNAIATTESQKTFGSSFSSGFGDAVTAPFDTTMEYLFSFTAGGPRALGALVLIVPPAVVVGVISLPISVPCGIVKGLVEGFQTLVGTQIPKG